MAKKAVKAKEPVIIPEPAKECGHENKHYTGSEKMLCVLEKGHTGNHTDGKDFWSDAAGIAIHK